jgi:hypothetical protein
MDCDKPVRQVTQIEGLFRSPLTVEAQSAMESMCGSAMESVSGLGLLPRSSDEMHLFSKDPLLSSIPGTLSDQPQNSRTPQFRQNGQASEGLRCPVLDPSWVQVTNSSEGQNPTATASKV